MQNLLKTFQKQQIAERKVFVKNLRTDYTCIEGMVSNRRIKQLLPKGKQKLSAWSDLKSLKAYVLKRYDLRNEKRLEEFVYNTQGDILKGIETIETLKITVEWKTNKTWGANPTAHIYFTYKDAKGQICGDSVSSSSVSGCGYDKESTAVAEALNQIDPLIKAMYRIKDKSPRVDNRVIFGYGSGYGLLPRFEGGVGVSCYPAIFDKLGLKWESIAGGKMFNVYLVTKK